MPKRYTPTSAAADVEAALRLLEGRWKLVILFHLFGGNVMRFSDLERAIPAITQKMLGQQLRSLAADGIVCTKQKLPTTSTIQNSLSPVAASMIFSVVGSSIRVVYFNFARIGMMSCE